jgi:hypothetical protein
MNYKSKPVVLTMSLALLFLIYFLFFEPKTTFTIQINNQKSKSIFGSQIMDIQRTIKSMPCKNTDRNVNKANEPCGYMQNITNRVGIFDDYDNSGHLSMSKSELHLARFYINTIKLSITNALYIQFNGLIDGSAWPPSGQGF